MNTGYKTPEQLESEADELLTQAGVLPPAIPDSEVVVATDKPDGEADPDAAAPAGDGAVDTSAATDGDDDPAKAKPASPAAADTDELEGLTLEHAQERIRNAQARMHRATQETAEFRRSNEELTARITVLEGQTTTLQAELAAAKANPPAKPDSDKSTGQHASLEALREDYPSLIDPILAVIEDLRAGNTALKDQVTALGGKVDQTSSAVTAKADDEAKKRKEAAAKKHFDTILAAHKDAFEINDSGEFQGWLDRQPTMYRYAMQKGSALDIIEVLDKYKKAIGAARIDTARAAATPSTPKARTQPNKTPKTFTRAEIDAMTPAQFAANEAEIDEAVAAGRVT